MNEEQLRKWNVGYWLIAIALLLFLQSQWQAANTVETVSYPEFEQALAEGRVAEVIIGDRVITGRLKTPDGRKVAIATARVEPDLAARLDRYNVP